MLRNVIGRGHLPPSPFLPRRHAATHYRFHRHISPHGNFPSGILMKLSY
jgi:hypothetical protein